MDMSHRGTDEMHNSRQKSEVQYIEHGANKTKKSQASSSPSSGRLSNKQNGGNKRCYRCGDPDHYADKYKHNRINIRCAISDCAYIRFIET